jgi:Leucine-rich repeat (LRR) protein
MSVMGVMSAKNSRFRFGLRALLVFTAAASVILGWVSKERRQSHIEHALAEKLKSLGVIATFRGPFEDQTESPFKQSTWRRLSGTILGTRIARINAQSKSIEDLTLLRGLKNLELLDLSETQVGDLGILATFNEIEVLLLNFTPVGDLTPLTNLKIIKRLDIAGTNVIDLTSVAKLTNLESLAIDHTKVHDLSPVLGLQKLKYFSLNRTQVSDEQIRTLKRHLPKCKIVH